MGRIGSKGEGRDRGTEIPEQKPFKATGPLIAVVVAAKITNASPLHP